VGGKRRDWPPSGREHEFAEENRRDLVASGSCCCSARPHAGRSKKVDQTRPPRPSSRPFRGSGPRPPRVIAGRPPPSGPRRRASASTSADLSTHVTARAGESKGETGESEKTEKAAKRQDEGNESKSAATEPARAASLGRAGRLNRASAREQGAAGVGPRRREYLRPTLLVGFRPLPRRGLLDHRQDLPARHGRRGAAQPAAGRPRPRRAVPLAPLRRPPAPWIQHRLGEGLETAGVSPATAKMIDGRPILRFPTSPRQRVSASTIEKISPLVARRHRAPSTRAVAPAARRDGLDPRRGHRTSRGALPGSRAGMVWVSRRRRSTTTGRSLGTAHQGGQVRDRGTLPRATPSKQKAASD
jgi:hypothetical protein